MNKANFSPDFKIRRNDASFLDRFQSERSKLPSLYGGAYDKRKDPLCTREDWENLMLGAFYCLRHVLELGIKAVIEILNDEFPENAYHHDILLLLEENIPNWSNISDLSVAIKVLQKHYILHNDQLCRYHINKQKKKYIDLPPVEKDDIETLIGAMDSVWILILECLHIKKRLPERGLGYQSPYVILSELKERYFSY